MHCGDNYPDEPPTIQFVSQVNLPAVNPRNGIVDPKMLPCLAQWKRDNTMETVLIELRRSGLSQSFDIRVRLLTEAGTWLPQPTRRSHSPPRVRPTHRQTKGVEDLTEGADDGDRKKIHHSGRGGSNYT